jgi:hypothetical protein
MTGLMTLLLLGIVIGIWIGIIIENSTCNLHLKFWKEREKYWFDNYCFLLEHLKKKDDDDFADWWKGNIKV